MTSQTIQTLDESLYSRQLYVIDKESMNSIQKSSVLISNLNGLGLEIAKCLTLGGIKSITLHDTYLTNYIDLTNYYLTEKDIGSNRAKACYDKIKDLNHNTQVNVNQDMLTEELIKTHNLVILVDYDLNSQIKYNELCRKNNVKFISCSTMGFLGQIFCDFGDNFEVKDINGEEIKTGIITQIENNVFITAQKHDLNADDIINVIGLHENVTSYQISKIISSQKFMLKTNMSFDSKILTNVSYEQSKVGSNFKFLSLAESLKNPNFVHIDQYNPETALLLHNSYVNLSNNMSNPWNSNDADNLVNHIKKTAMPNINVSQENMIRNISFGAQAKICAMQAVIGSIVAQESMKACIHKFTPIVQHMYFESLSCMPKDRPTDYDDLNTKSRYFGQTVIFGDAYQDFLLKQKVFIVGAGAIGCEHLKNFAMIGTNLVVTDMDTIEKSNLSRQFLFRNSDIGSMKSITACKKAKELNPDIKIEAHQNRVGNETQHIYNQTFFKSLTCVANALDNVPARLFVDSLCVAYQTPLIESGTLGSKCNVQVIIPHKTLSYGSTQDPPEQTIPVCTLKNFPYMIEHTIQWARELFEELFNQLPSKALTYDCNANMTPTEKIDLINNLDKFQKYLAKTFDQCIENSFKIWHELYRDQIESLLVKYPNDYIDKESGVAFWSGSKKMPRSLVFDESYYDFVVYCSNLWAHVFNIQKKDRFYVINYLKKLETPQLVINTGIIVETNKDNQVTNNQTEILDDKKLPDKRIFNDYKISPINFEKDDDSHMDFITHASNARAINYQIKPVDKLKTKGIAGKIIPAIATTTSLVSGLVALEYYKLVNTSNKLEVFRDTYVNLAISLYNYTEPLEVRKQKIKDLEFTFWDSFEFYDATLQDVIDHFSNKYDIDITGFTVGQTMLLTSFLPQAKQKDRKKKKFNEVYYEITKEQPPSNPIQVTIIADLDEDSETENQATLPLCKVYY
jgi:ubiquitin-activating enzyme E1